jgi:hypothetical protein
MKTINLKNTLLAGAVTVLASCGGQEEVKMESYAYDAQFLKDNGIEYTELVSADGNSRVLIVPAWQGRVMTTSASGNEGSSYGWINYRFILEGRTSPQFNPVGGEERFWLGPEGGPFSLYFKQGQEQVYDNWVVPAVLDTEAFTIKSQDKSSIHFAKDACLINAAGTTFDIHIDRTVSLMDAAEVAADFGIQLSRDMKIVAYKSDNKITNTGNNAWTKEGGLVSVWMLSMFNPTPTTTVFIPYKEDAAGAIVNDEYFGKIPTDRLIKENGIIYFKIDGKYRSKLGLPASRATNLCGSYDSSKGVLTILWCSLPDTPSAYVNGQWGPQEDPFAGDVINSYNDGPVEDGSIMGPFYEIETSSPGAELAPGASLVHTQKVIHIQGEDGQLAPIVQQLFGADLNVIKTKFQ